MPPLRGSGRVFHLGETRAGEGREDKTCGRRAQQTELFIFSPKKATPRPSKPHRGGIFVARQDDTFVESEILAN